MKEYDTVMKHDLNKCFPTQTVWCSRGRSSRCEKAALKVCVRSHSQTNFSHKTTVCVKSCFT